MRIIGSKDEIAALPEWAREFLAVGWSPPDNKGQRAALKASAATFKDVAQRFSNEMTRGLRDPEICLNHFSFALRERDESGFSQIVVWSDGNFAIAADLANAWNYGATISECVVCGSLMMPAKGRIARTCSAACRLELHRKGRKDG